ncbi:zinc finger protein 271-like [Penaeus monodon]|uniref:zinc finger protein 271-like n=1 Tax=Penaeus monodon TaxID=6687 RepID=UPI0018A788A9|nr:zinc finger protein 271-like [Penaeus monodon]
MGNGNEGENGSEIRAANRRSAGHLVVLDSQIRDQESSENHNFLVMMSFLGDGMRMAPLTGKEIVGIGVGVKEELSEDVAEDTCLEIKEEPLDYGDETGNDSCNLVQDGNDMSKVPFGVKECGKTCSSDGVQVMYEESLKEEPQLKVESTRKCFAYEKPFSYELYNKSISQKHNLVKNMRVHTKKKTYSCDTCSKKLSERSYLVKHIRVHTNEKPYICEIWNNTFLLKSHLVRHMRKHTKEKPYSCEICNKDFSRKSNVAIHMRRWSSKPHETSYTGESI